MESCIYHIHIVCTELNEFQVCMFLGMTQYSSHLTLLGSAKQVAQLKPIILSDVCSFCTGFYTDELDTMQAIISTIKTALVVCGTYSTCLKILHQFHMRMLFVHSNNVGILNGFIGVAMINRPCCSTPPILEGNDSIPIVFRTYGKQGVQRTRRCDEPEALRKKEGPILSTSKACSRQ